MDGITELAKMLRERENPPGFVPMVGAVIDDNLRVSLGNKIILTSDNLIWCKHVLPESGDSVLLLPAKSLNKFYVVGVI